MTFIGTHTVISQEQYRQKYTSSYKETSNSVITNDLE